MNKFPWWIILIIFIVFLLILYFVIPWSKINAKRKEKSDLINEPKEYIDSEIDKKITEAKENPNNKPMLGIYNWFGKKEALRLKTIVYVQPEEDSCELCRPFENQILSLEEYDNQYIIMKEAIYKGYHHIRCKNIDIDYFTGTTKIPDKRFSEKKQIEKHNIVLGLYKLENSIRNRKYEYDNVKSSEELNLKINQKSNEIDEYCKKNKIDRNLERENPSITDLEKFR